MRFEHVRLRAARALLPDLAGFYGTTLGFPVRVSPGATTVAAGETTLELVGAPGEPFYHFALLVPGNRFDAALAWGRANTTLLPHPGSGDDVFDFAFWHAHACYVHDPAGNIVELIAHRGVDENDADGGFRATEITGLSELGLVGEQRPMAESLAASFALEVWDGTIEDPRALAFVGEQARTLILAPEGRGWLPTGRPAERHAVEALLAAPRAGEATLEAGRYRIRSAAP